MRFDSLRIRIIFFISLILIISLATSTYFIKLKVKDELSNAIEENAKNLLGATKNHVESQYNSILYHRKIMLERRQIELKNTTTIAFAMVNSAYKQFQNGTFSETEAKRHAINDLQKVRYDNGVGYFWINDTIKPYPRMIMHPTIPDLDGKILDDSSFFCALGKKENLFKASVDVCTKNEEGYIDYLWPKPTKEGLTEQQPKISFVKSFKPWNWIIGSGVYIDDIENSVRLRLNAVIEDLNNTIPNQRISESGYFFIFDEDKKMLVHPTLSGTDGNLLINPSTGNKLLDDFKKATFSNEKSLEYLWDKPENKGEFRFIKKAFFTYYEPLGWYICSSIYKEDFEKIITNITFTMILISSIFLSISLILAIIVSRSIVNPLKLLINSIEATDEDGIPQNVIQISGTSEIATLGNTMNNMVEKISKSRTEIKSERDFSLGIINSAPYIICGLDVNGITQFINPQGEKITGYLKSELKNQNWWELFFPGNKYNQVEKMHERFPHKKVFNYEMTITCKNRLQKNIIWNSFVKTDEASRIIEVIGFGNDITDRKIVEEALYESETKHRSLVENLGKEYFFYSLDKDKNIMYVSPSVKDMLGYETEEFKMNFLEFFSSNPINEMKNKITEDCIKGIKQKPYLLEIYNKSKELRWIEISETPIFDLDNNVVAVEAIVHDITNAKRSKEKLVQLQNYLSNIINSMPSMLIGLDQNHMVTQWNKSVEKYTNIKAEDAQGKNLEEIFPYMKEYLFSISESMKINQIKHEKKKSRIKNNEKIYEDITIYPLIGDGVDGAVIRIDDVSDIVKMEERVIQSEKMLSVGGLAAGMAHEINNPLAGIIQNVQVLRNRLLDDLPGNKKIAQSLNLDLKDMHEYFVQRKIDHMLDSINVSGLHAAEIVKNMLSFARKDSRDMGYYLISDLLDKTIIIASSDYDLKKKYDIKKITFFKNYDPNEERIKCSPTKIQQVFLNIIKNGSEAISEKEYVDEDPTINIDIIMEKEWINIEIQDNGPGMEEDIKKRIFEPFYTTKNVGIGTGLGLSVSYFIITENHKGKMYVESNKGNGTKFIIKLPLYNVC